MNEKAWKHMPFCGMQSEIYCVDFGEPAEIFGNDCDLWNQNKRPNYHSDIPAFLTVLPFLRYIHNQTYILPSRGHHGALLGKLEARNYPVREGVRVPRAEMRSRCHSPGKWGLGSGSPGGQWG